MRPGIGPAYSRYFVTTSGPAKSRFNNPSPSVTGLGWIWLACDNILYYSTLLNHIGKMHIYKIRIRGCTLCFSTLTKKTHICTGRTGTYIPAHITTLTTRKGYVHIQCSKAKEQNFSNFSNYIVKPSYHLIYTYKRYKSSLFARTRPALRVLASLYTCHT